MSAAVCHPDRKAKGRGLCAPCYDRDWVAKNPEQRAATQSRWAKSNRPKLRDRDRRCMMRKYGITTEVYEAMLQAQGGVCAVCGKKDRQRLAVDHDHKTGLVRQLLCGRCNRVLGLVEESLDILTALGQYLHKHVQR